MKACLSLKCNKCPALSETRRKIVWGEWVNDEPHPQVMGIAEAPGPEEDRVGRPLIGTSGREARQHLDINGITTMGLYLTNVLKCHPPNNRDPKPDEMANCLPHLKQEIKDVNPQYIITMGRYATRALLGDIDMEMVHGIPHKWGGKVVIPTYHPAAGLHDPNLMVMFHADMRIAGAVCRGKILPYHVKDKWKGEEEYQLAKPSEKVNYYTHPPRSTDAIAIDTEWAEGKPWGLSLSTQPGEAFVIRYGETELLQKVNQIVQGDITTVIHNALYDLPVLAQMGIYPAKVADTMVMAYLLQNEPQALKVLAYRHCGMKMNSYAEMVSPATKVKALEYLELASLREWPDSKPVLEWPKGEPHVRQPQNIGRRIRRILADNHAGKDIDPFKRWNQIDDRSEVESMFGRLTEADLSDIPRQDAIQYSARDADATIRIYPLLWERIRGMGLEDVFWRDMRMMPMVVDMMANGMPADLPRFAELSSYFQSRMIEIERDITTKVGYHVNPASHDQCAKLIYDDLKLHEGKGSTRSKKGKTKRSTAVDVIKKMEHPVTDAITEWRQYQKLKTTYADVMPKLVSDDGRVRTTLRITRVATGRLSSSKPNLLAVPVRTEEGRKIRDGYVATDGWSFVSADYSQIEMKVAAFDSGDETMCNIFINGEDLHNRTASWMFDVDEDKLDEMEHRYPAKRIGFGIIYGLTPQGLHRELASEGINGWALPKCEETIASWFWMFPGIKKYLRAKVEEARRYGYVRDCWGRIRYIPGIRSNNKWIRLEAERQAGNTPVQSGAQGVIKEAMGRLVSVYKELVAEGYDVRSLLQIHDDLLWEVRDDSLGLVIPIVKDVMEGATPPNLPLPLEVDVKVGKRWGSTSKW